MPKFNLYYGIEQERYNLHTEQEVELLTLHDAKKEARECAEDLYMQNPVRDIQEIEKEEGVDFDTAKILFKLDMFRKTLYHVEEIIEVNGKVIEVIRHDYR